MSTRGPSSPPPERGNGDADGRRLMTGHRRSRWRGGLRAATLTARMAMTALLAGCMVGPDFYHPATPAAADYPPEPLPATAAADVHGGAAQRFVRDRDIPGQW